MRAIGCCAWLAIGGLALSASAPLYADEPDAQALIAQIQQIQGEIEAEAQGSQDASGQPRPAIGEDEMRAIVQRSLGVEILRLEVVERDGQPAYAITVMNPPGNRNDAFRVATLLFDGATGSLLGQESPAPETQASGLPTATTPSGIEASGPEIRRRSNR